MEKLGLFLLSIIQCSTGILRLYFCCQSRGRMTSVMIVIDAYITLTVAHLRINRLDRSLLHTVLFNRQMSSHDLVFL